MSITGWPSYGPTGSSIPGRLAGLPFKARRLVSGFGQDRFDVFYSQRRGNEESDSLYDIQVGVSWSLSHSASIRDVFRGVSGKK